MGCLLLIKTTNDQAMLHLAQVRRNSTSGKMELQLLAHQKSEFAWAVSESIVLPFEEEEFLNEGLLLLVELCENSHIINVREAKDWVINLVKQYLTKDLITPAFIEAEQLKIEQWRQELTSQSQDLTRLRLEIETRREQLQELEANLRLEREKLQLKIRDDG